MIATLFRTLPPLVVSAFGRVWHLTPRFEPVWWREGRLAALEILSHVQDRDSGAPLSPEIFFSQLSLQEQSRVLRWQLEVLMLMAPWCASRDVLVSLNITRPLAILSLSDPKIQEALFMLAPRVRIEINEDFLPTGAKPRQDPLLPDLKQLAPLWLDDFGAGSTGLSWLLSGLFETLKIDRHLLEALPARPGGEGFLAGLCGLAHGAGLKVIAEGVADQSLLAFVRNTQVDACQGWLWPGVGLDQLYPLPEWLPGTS